MLALAGLVAALGGIMSPGAQSAPATNPNAAHVRAIQPQIYPNWMLACDDPAFVRLRVVLDVSVDRNGRLTRQPEPVRPETTPGYADALARARTAVIRSAPFRMPEDFEGGEFRLVFAPQRACRNR